MSKGKNSCHCERCEAGYDYCVAAFLDSEERLSAENTYLLSALEEAIHLTHVPEHAWDEEDEKSRKRLCALLESLKTPPKEPAPSTSAEGGKEERDA